MHSARTLDQQRMALIPVIKAACVIPRVVVFLRGCIGSDDFSVILTTAPNHTTECSSLEVIYCSLMATRDMNEERERDV